MAFLDSVLQRVPVDDITAAARRVHAREVVAAVVRALLTTVAAVLFGTGWVAGRVVVVTWRAAVWSAVAVRVGWRAGRGSA